jgi:hypothetical protein
MIRFNFHIRQVNPSRLREFFCQCCFWITALILIGLTILSLIGLGYITECIFTNKYSESYKDWQIFFMKFAIICAWIGIAQNLFFYRENVSKKSENNIEQV